MGVNFAEDGCKDVACGQGICKPSNNSTIPYECECSPGWKQVANFDDDNGFLKTLPCVIPNCKSTNSWILCFILTVASLKHFFVKVESRLSLTCILHITVTMQGLLEYVSNKVYLYLPEYIVGNKIT